MEAGSWTPLPLPLRCCMQKKDEDKEKEEKESGGERERRRCVENRNEIRRRQGVPKGIDGARNTLAPGYLALR